MYSKDEIEKYNKINHYDWLDINFPIFCDNMGLYKKLWVKNKGIITAHGDKCWSYADK